MRIERFDVLQVALPFRSAFQHAAAVRTHSNSIFVRCELEDGSVGFGESLPRAYVTGETCASVFALLRDRVLPLLLAECDLGGLDELARYCAELLPRLRRSLPGLPRYMGATCCAAELALLDAYGRSLAATVFDRDEHEQVRYSGVVSSRHLHRISALAVACRRWRVPAVKLKVGVGRDRANAWLCRAILGRDVSLRVDANGSWSAEDAARTVRMLRAHGIEYVEQPLPPGQLRELRELQDRTRCTIVADEDLRDLEDGERLVSAGACRVFNVRVSKCGGFFESLRIARFALDHGLEVQVGCHVGESALLSAVGLAVARRVRPVFTEGAFGRRLLEDDVLEDEAEFRFGVGGEPPEYRPRAGLGLAIDERRLIHFCVARAVVARRSRHASPRQDHLWHRPGVDGPARSRV